MVDQRLVRVDHVRTSQCILHVGHDPRPSSCCSRYVQRHQHGMHQRWMWTLRQDTIARIQEYQRSNAKREEKGVCVLTRAAVVQAAFRASEVDGLHGACVSKNGRGQHHQYSNASASVFSHM